MSDELEKRLRKLVHSKIKGELLTNLPLEIAREAARIGAELEREECAKVADSLRNADHQLIADTAGDIAFNIRARGAK